MLCNNCKGIKINQEVKLITLKYLVTYKGRQEIKSLITYKVRQDEINLVQRLLEEVHEAKKAIIVYLKETGNYTSKELLENKISIRKLQSI